MLKYFQITPALTFAAGLLISSLLVSPYVLDYTLNIRLISICFFIAAGFYLLYQLKLKEAVIVDPLLAAGILFVGVNVSSVFWAGNQAEALFEGAKIMVAGLIFLFTVFLLKKQPDFNPLCGKSSVVIFYIVFLSAMIQVSSLPDFSKTHAYLVTGINGHKNLLSSFLFLNLFFVIRFFRTNGPGAWKLFSLIAILLSLLLIIFLRTKAVWLAIAGATLLFLMLVVFKKTIKTVPGKKTVVGLIVILMLLANFLFLFLLPRLLEKAADENADKNNLITRVLRVDEERLALWNKTYYVFKKHALLGTGLGNWQVQFPDATLSGLYRAEDLNYTFQRPHNDFLWILSETGIVGLNLLFVFVLSIFVLLFLIILAKKDATSEMLMFCALAGYCMISFFDFPKERVEHLIWLHVLLGLCYFTVRQNTTLPTLFKTRMDARVSVSFMVISLFLLLTALQRYKAEYYTRQMYDLKGRQEYFKLIKACNHARSFACTLDPTSVPLAWYSGNAYAALGQYNKAKQQLLLAYEHNPYNRNVLNDLASAFIFEKDTARAIQLYEEAARVSPRFDEPRLNLAAVYIQQKKYKEADAWLKSIKHDSKRRSNYQAIVNIRLAESASQK